MKLTIYNEILKIWIAKLHVIKKYFPEFEPLKLAKICMHGTIANLQVPTCQSIAPLRGNHAASILQ